MKRFPLWSWFWILAGTLYFALPLMSTFIFSLQMKRDVLSFAAYESAFSDPEFLHTYGYSAGMAVLTVIFGILLVVPTAYWVHLYFPTFRPVMEFLSLLPFVVPAIVLVFGLIGIYSRPPLLLTINETTTSMLLVASYIVLSLPYLYRGVDLGLRAINVRTLTEAAENLGAKWPTILFRLILPNLRTALITSALLTFAIVVGEVTVASFLGVPAFGPYFFLVGQHRAYEPTALAIVTFGQTWGSLGIISAVMSTSPNRQAQITGGH
jgi:putative spermidine/putrescine transport system permease protein